MVDLFLRANGKRRCFLGVERTEGDVVLASLLQVGIGRDKINDVSRFSDFVDFVLRDAHANEV